jgi:glycosyltransferase involved in cell wall biosynthesis
MKVLVVCDYFLPGTFAGGPLRSLSALIDALGDEIHFDVLTRDRDVGQNVPYPELGDGRWHPMGKAQVRYLTPSERRPWRLRQVIREAAPDVIYLNTLLSTAFAVPILGLRRIGALPCVPFILTPRGQLAAGALALKSTKKRLFLEVAKRTRLCSGIVWHAASDHEARDIVDCFPGALVRVVPNLSERPRLPDAPSGRPTKKSGELRLVFIGRIARNKGLHLALEALKGVRGAVEFRVFGPEEDVAYLNECRAIAGGLPSGLAVHFAGPLPFEKVGAELYGSDLFVLLSAGESFGHAALEALFAGCPLLLSDRTPWRDLQAKGIGWDVSLGDLEQTQKILQRCVDMETSEHRGPRSGAVPS